MRIIPNSYGSAFKEANDCHLPAGSPAGGQFCSKGGGMARVWLDSRLGRETVGQYVARHRLEVTPEGRIVMYHGRPKTATHDTLWAGTYLGENPKESAFYAARDRDLTPEQVEVFRLEIDPDDFEPGSFATMRREVPLADMRARRVGGPPTFVLSPHDKRAGRSLVVLDMAKADAAWQRDAGFHIAPGGAAGAIGDRYARFQKFLTTGQPVQASTVHIYRTPDGAARIGFTDGRHRFAVLRDLGLKTIKVALSADDRALAEELGLTVRKRRRRLEN